MLFKCHKAIAVALLALLYVSPAHATTIINCKDPILAVILDVAVDEAVTMARDAANKLALENKMEATNKAAWQPLFSQSALPQVIDIYQKIANLKTNPEMELTIFCQEDHIQLDQRGPEPHYWQDLAYRDLLTGERGFQGFHISQSEDELRRPVRRKPGALGSYSTLGRKSKSQKRDTSNQAHTHIDPAKLATESDKHGKRHYAEIIADGFVEGSSPFHTLDSLKPPAQTVFHELVHVVRGYIEGTRELRIKDKVIGKDKGIYGWVDCHELRLADVNGPLKIADSYTVCAQALHLNEVARGDVFWSWGIVDESGLPVKLKLKGTRDVSVAHAGDRHLEKPATGKVWVA